MAMCFHEAAVIEQGGLTRSADWFGSSGDIANQARTGHTCTEASRVLITTPKNDFR